MKADYLQVPSKKWARWNKDDPSTATYAGKAERVNAYFIKRMEEKAQKTGGFYVHATPLHPSQAANKTSLYRKEIQEWIYKDTRVR
jgi:hypothetical protein